VIGREQGAGDEQLRRIERWVSPGHGGLSLAAGDGAQADSRLAKVESMLVMSGGEGYIDFRIGGCWGATGPTAHAVAWPVESPP
jgi:hypothetical protein